MKKFLQIYNRFVAAGNSVCYVIAAIATVLMTLNVLLSAICTWVFGIAFPVPVDITGILLLFAICFAYPSFQHRDGFVRVDILTHNMKGTRKKVFELISLMISLVFYLLTVYSAWKLTYGNIATQQRLTSIALVIWPFSLGLFLSMAWSSVVTLNQVFNVIAYGVPEKKSEVTSM